MSFKTTNEILGGFTLWPHNFTLANYHKIFTDPTWYKRLLNSIIYVSMNTVISVAVGAAGRLCFLALPLPRRQASVLLAADQPHGAAGGVRAAVLPALFGDRAVRHAHRRGAGALPVQHPARGVDPRGLHVAACRRRSTRPPISTATRFPRSSCKIFMPLIAAGIGVAAFFCFMFSWVELLLAKTLTSVAAKPIAATMTRTASTSGYETRAAGGRRRAHHHSRRGRDLFRAQLHRQGLCPRAGVMERIESRPLMDGLDVADGDVLRRHRPAARAA